MSVIITLTKGIRLQRHVLFLFFYKTAVRQRVPEAQSRRAAAQPLVPERTDRRPAPAEGQSLPDLRRPLRTGLREGGRSPGAGSDESALLPGASGV